MAENNVKNEKTIGSKAAEESYKAAKLLKQGSRELDRQLNTKTLKNR